MSLYISLAFSKRAPSATISVALVKLLVPCLKLGDLLLRFLGLTRRHLARAGMLVDLAEGFLELGHLGTNCSEIAVLHFLEEGHIHCFRNGRRFPGRAR